MANIVCNKLFSKNRSVFSRSSKIVKNVCTLQKRSFNKTSTEGAEVNVNLSNG